MILAAARQVQSSPELIIISAGFDAHYRDPLASLNLKAEDFRLGHAQVDGCRRSYRGGTNCLVCLRAAMIFKA